MKTLVAKFTNQIKEAKTIGENANFKATNKNIKIKA